MSDGDEETRDDGLYEMMGSRVLADAWQVYDRSMSQRLMSADVKASSGHFCVLVP
jgi:hypothetical protein